MLTSLLASNKMPDVVVRAGIRHLLRMRLNEEGQGGLEAVQQRFNALIDNLKQAPIAINTQDANEQHYEVPAAFYSKVLGKHLKYSCGWWDSDTQTLDEAELAMLARTCDRAALADGQDILELGCGWGSLTLYMAARYPGSRITAVSNSHSQRRFIQEQCAERQLTNVQILTYDMNEFTPKQAYDRVVSVEMFEHMRNYQKLFAKIHKALRPEGLLFVHIFVHRTYAYPFEVRNETDWMAKYFFSGGIMPSDHLLLYFAEGFAINHHQRVNGKHYGRTADAWLANMDRNRRSLMPLFRATYGEEARKWWAWWRIFFMACSELWHYRNGEEWFVSHYQFRKI